MTELTGSAGQRRLLAGALCLRILLEVGHAAPVCVRPPPLPSPLPTPGHFRPRTARDPGRRVKPAGKQARAAPPTVSPSLPAAAAVFGRTAEVPDCRLFDRTHVLRGRKDIEPPQVAVTGFQRLNIQRYLLRQA